MSISGFEGKRLGPYRVTGVIGRGGMGVVLRAVHVETGVEHALKLILAAFLELQGLTPLSQDHVFEVWRELDVGELIALGDAENDRTDRPPNPALLVAAARLLDLISTQSQLPQNGPIALRWTDAALASGIEARWLLAPAAVRFDWLDRDDGEVLALVRRAYDLDRALPLERRWPFITSRYVDAIVDALAGGDADVPDPSLEPALVEAAALAAEAIRIQEVAFGRLRAITEAGGDPPETIDATDSIVKETETLARRMVSLGRPRCCDLARENDVPGPVELLAGIVGLAERAGKPYAAAQALSTWGRHDLAHRRVDGFADRRVLHARVVRDDRRTRDTDRRDVLLWRSVRQLSSCVEVIVVTRRHGLAVEVAGEAIALANELLAAALEPDPARLLELAFLHVQRAGSRRAAGDDAGADDDRARALAIATGIESSDDALTDALELIGKGDGRGALERIEAALTALPRAPRDDSGQIEVMVRLRTAKALCTALLGDLRAADAELDAAERLRRRG